MSLHMGAATDARAGVLALVDTLLESGIEKFGSKRLDAVHQTASPIYPISVRNTLLAHTTALTYYRVLAHTHTHIIFVQHILQYHFYVVVVATRQVFSEGVYGSYLRS